MPAVESRMRTVAAAILCEAGRVLVAQRADTRGPLAGKWEFPGGKLEPGETPQACLVRELREELGIDVAVVALFGETMHVDQQGAFRLIAYRVRWLNGALALRVHTQVAWVTPDEARLLDLLPADVPLVAELDDCHAA